MKRSISIAALCMTGCAPLMSKTLGQGVDIMIYPKVEPKTLAIIQPYSLSSIATLDVIPYVEDSGTYKPISSVTGSPTTPGASDQLKLTQASPSIDPSRPFILRKLKANKNYRVRAQAYSQSNALISDDSTSYVDFSVGSNDTPPMANLPVRLVSTPFSATASVLVSANGHYDYLNSTLYLMAGGAPLAVSQTRNQMPELVFNNIQGATDYRLVIEGYKLGTMMASTSLMFNVDNNTTPAAYPVSLTIPYVVSTVAGNGTNAFAEGVGVNAAFSNPHGLAVDNQGNAYVGDMGNNRIRKVVLATGAVSTLAGNGTPTFGDGTGTNATFYSPVGVVHDGQGSLYITDMGNHRIRKIVLASGAVSTVAGNGSPAFLDGSGTNASFSSPRGIDLDASGNLYVSEAGNHRIRKIVLATGAVTTLVGNGTPTKVDGTGTAATLNSPEGVTVDNRGNLYIADTYNHVIRKVDLATRAVSTLAGNGALGFADGTGTAAQFYHPVSVMCDLEGNVIVGDFNNNRIRRVTPGGVVSTLAGNGNNACVDGTGLNTQISHPEEVIMDNQGILYFSDFGTGRIRKME